MWEGRDSPASAHRAEYEDRLLHHPSALVEDGPVAVHPPVQALPVRSLHLQDSKNKEKEKYDIYSTWL